jgi:L-lactate dehydrogenase
VHDAVAGVRDVALSLPVIVGRSGAVEVLEPELDPEERLALERSAQTLRRAKESIS